MSRCSSTWRSRDRVEPLAAYDLERIMRLTVSFRLASSSRIACFLTFRLLSSMRRSRLTGLPGLHWIPGYHSHDGAVELYNLVDESLEMTNAAARSPKIVKELLSKTGGGVVMR